jgi:hypothetical protein
MSLDVRFRMMQGCAYPSATGSYNFRASSEIIVQNLGYEKHVSLWNGKDGIPWGDLDAGYDNSLPGNLERWTINGKPDADRFFDAKYEVNGQTYWDNNDGWNYQSIDYGYDELNVITGRYFPVIHGQSTLTSSSLTVYAGIQNLAYEKTVGLVYTTDNWVTYDTIYASYLWTMKSGLEVWKFDKSLSNVSKVEFAIFYKVNGCEYWDNNFYQNYTATSIQLSGLKETKPDLKITWEKPVLTKKTPKKPAVVPEVEPKIVSKEPQLESAML